MEIPKWRGDAPSSRVTFHRLQHFPDGSVQPDDHGAADNAVTDVELDQVRDDVQERHVLTIQSVPGVHLQPELVRLLRRGNQPFEFDLPFALAMEVLRVSARVQFDELRTDRHRGVDLHRIRSDEEAHVDAGVVHSLAGCGQGGELSGHIQTAFGRHFLTPFWNEADDLGPDLERELNDLRSVAHFQIQPRRDPTAKLHDIVILNVPSIFPEMRGDSESARGFTNQSGFDGTGFAFGPSTIAGLAEGGDVVNVYAQLEWHGEGAAYFLPGGGVSVGLDEFAAGFAGGALVLTRDFIPGIGSGNPKANGKPG